MARPDADGEIVCTGCDRSLPGTVEYYHRHRDAFKPQCKECRGTEFGIHQVKKVLESPDGEKFCAQCRSLLPADADHFHRNASTSDGFTTACKKCRSGVDYGIHRPNRVGKTPDGRDIPDGMWCRRPGRPAGRPYQRSDPSFPPRSPGRNHGTNHRGSRGGNDSDRRRGRARMAVIDTGVRRAVEGPPADGGRR